jgi:urease beta subunit
VSPTSIDFGKVRSDHRVSKDITLTNNGSVAVKIHRIHLTFGAHTEREVFRFTRTCGLRLNVGASCIVRVEFEADDPGVANAVLHIVDSAAGSPQTVTLTGTTVR